MFGMPNKIGLKSTLLPDNIIFSLKSEEDFEITFNFIATLLKISDDCSNNEIENVKGKIE